MKYLGIHKLLWATIVLVFTLIEAIIVLGIWVIYTIWNFYPPKNLWMRLHTNDCLSSFFGDDYSDKNVWQTVKRRYKVLV